MALPAQDTDQNVPDASASRPHPPPKSTATVAGAELLFKSRGWTPFPFQRDAWTAYAQGKSGLIHAPTGLGKTYAAFCAACALGPAGNGRVPSPPVAEGAAKRRDRGTVAAARSLAAPATVTLSPTPPPSRGRGENASPPIAILWVTPLKALAADTTLSLKEASAAMQPTWTVGLRTGDVSSSERAKQDRRLPTVLVTTPESLALMLARADWRERLGTLRTVIVDEWHELLSSKRGVLLELCLTRLRGANRHLQTWGMSATLGNLDEAMRVLIGPDAALGRQGVLISGKIDKKIVIDSLLPETIERFPWGGHLGVRMVQPVVGHIRRAKSTLIFTNTRSQTELWYQALLDAEPDLAGQIALHHGSLDRETREYVEQGIRSGALRAVVCTSSLDLGVDFRPVEQVLQIGSPKGIARILQRAGRSGHQPGATSRVTVVPTHALELVEAAASRQAADARHIESRSPLGSGGAGNLGAGKAWRPLDVLTQHLVTCALGGGFDAFRGNKIKVETVAPRWRKVSPTRTWVTWNGNGRLTLWCAAVRRSRPTPTSTRWCLTRKRDVTL